MAANKVQQKKNTKRNTRYQPKPGPDEKILTDLDIVERGDGVADAFMGLRVAASKFGEQHLYNSVHAIMWARRVCYMFIRPRSSYLELTFFLPKEAKDSFIRRTTAVSKTRVAHLVKLESARQLNAPLKKLLKEAYEHSV